MTDANEKPETTDTDTLIALSTDIVAAYVTKNSVTATDLPNLIQNVHAALRQTQGAAQSDQGTDQKPAVPINKSVTKDKVICLECGKAHKSLTRHLRTAHGLTPDEYRAKWNLPGDYPMVSKSYSERRSNLAKQFGLGRKT